MPIRSDKKINKHSRVVVWEIEESPEWFLSRLALDEDETEKYNGFRTDQRRVHWLAYRYILKNIVGKGNDIRITQDENNKPFIDLRGSHISVSHSGKFASVIVSENHSVGIDVEEVNKRLHRVGEKFLNKDETGLDIGAMSTEDLCVHWCAKEALYKMHGERKLDFRDHILVKGIPAGREGDFKGMIRSGGSEQHYRLRSEKLDNYYMVYVVDNPDK